MSIVEDARAPPNPRLIQGLGYGLTIFGAVMGVVAEFVASPVVAAVALVVGPLALALALTAPKLFEVQSRRGSRGFNFLLFAPALTLMFTAFAVDMVTFQVPLIAGAAGIAVGAAVGAIAMRRSGLATPVMLPIFTALFGGCYAFGAAVIADTRFDAAPTQMIRTTVSDTFWTHGKGTVYYVRLPAWGPKTGPNEVSVAPELYRKLGPGDDVCIQLHPGLLHAAWFTLDKCAVQSDKTRSGDEIMPPIQVPDFANSFSSEPAPPSPANGQ